MKNMIATGHSKDGALHVDSGQFNAADLFDHAARVMRKQAQVRMDAIDACCEYGIHPPEGRTRDAFSERCGHCGRRVL